MRNGADKTNVLVSARIAEVYARLRKATENKSKSENDSSNSKFEAYTYLAWQYQAQLRVLYEEAHHGEISKAEAYYFCQLSNLIANNNFDDALRILPKENECLPDVFLLAMYDFKQLLLNQEIDDKLSKLKFLNTFKTLLEIFKEELRLAENELPNQFDQYFLEYLEKKYKACCEAKDEDGLCSIARDIKNYLENDEAAQSTPGSNTPSVASTTESDSEAVSTCSSSSTPSPSLEVNEDTILQEINSKRDEFYKKSNDLLKEVVAVTAELLQEKSKTDESAKRSPSHLTYLWNNGHYYNGDHYDRRPQLVINLSRKLKLTAEERAEKQSLDTIRDAAVELMQEYALIDGNLVTGLQEKLKAHTENAAEDLLDYCYRAYGIIQDAYYQELVRKAKCYFDKLFEVYVTDLGLLDDFCVKEKFKTLFEKFAYANPDTNPRDDTELKELIQLLKNKGIKVHKLIADIESYVNPRLLAIKSAVDKELTKLSAQTNRLASVLALPQRIVPQVQNSFADKPCKLEAVGLLVIDHATQQARRIQVSVNWLAEVITSGFAVNEGIVAGVGAGMTLGGPTAILGTISNYTLVIEDTKSVLKDLYNGHLFQDKKGNDIGVVKKLMAASFGMGAASSGLSYATLGWDSCKNQIASPLLGKIGASKLAAAIVGSTAAAVPAAFMFVGLTCILFDGSVALIRDTKRSHVEKYLNKQCRLPYQEMSNSEKLGAIPRGVIKLCSKSAAVGVAVLYSWVAYRIFKNKLPILLKKIPGVKAVAALMLSKVISGSNAGLFFVFNTRSLTKLADGITPRRVAKLALHTCLSPITLAVGFFSGVCWAADKLAKPNKKINAVKEIFGKWLGAINRLVDRHVRATTYSRLEDSCEGSDKEATEAVVVQANPIQRKFATCRTLTKVRDAVANGFNAIPGQYGVAEKAGGVHASIASAFAAGSLVMNSTAAGKILAASAVQTVVTQKKSDQEVGEQHDGFSKGAAESTSPRSIDMPVKKFGHNRYHMFFERATLQFAQNQIVDKDEENPVYTA